ncbi:hypothetical protein BsWGS_27671 [Bradybaena similaris]
MVPAPSPKAEGDLREPVVVAAEWLVHLALIIYLYTVFGCMTFKSQFFRQMAVIFQLIKLFIIFGGILPCVLHSQAQTIFPGFSGTVSRFIVIGLLLSANVWLAFYLRKPQQVFSKCLELMTKKFGCLLAKAAYVRKRR